MFIGNILGELKGDYEADEKNPKKVNYNNKKSFFDNIYKDRNKLRLNVLSLNESFLCAGKVVKIHHSEDKKVNFI